MKIRTLEIQNLRSIVSADTIPVSNLLALVGENNSGKSNILYAINAFLTGGNGGLKLEDFNDIDKPIVIKIVFEELNEVECKRWKKYLVSNRLILEKRVYIDKDESTGNQKLKSEYHGYISKPADWFLSIDTIICKNGTRPKWKEIAEENDLPEYFVENDKSTKEIYNKALDRYIEENDVTFEEPDLSQTQALGLQSNVIASLPAYYMLPAITDYSDEIDKRQKSSTFRRLMGELSERILKKDPRFKEVQDSLDKVYALFNDISQDSECNRLGALGHIEDKICSLLKELMPSVDSVKLTVQIDELKDIFSRGVALTVDDGVETDVLAKGHGLQRCIVFSLLQTLIETDKSAQNETGMPQQSIILGIEEPELYIHPQLCKLFYDVMRNFSKTDQIIYATHSPLFVDVYNYNEVAIVRKPSISEGTKVQYADSSVFDDLDEPKMYKNLSRFNPSVNELFFAGRILVVEGLADFIAVTETLKKMGRINTRIEELGHTILIAGGKDAMPFFQRVMNAFEMKYVVLHDSDITETMNKDKKEQVEKINNTIVKLAGERPVHVFPHKLETIVGIDGHFKDPFNANQFFSKHENINDELQNIIGEIFHDAC